MGVGQLMLQGSTRELATQLACRTLHVGMLMWLEFNLNSTEFGANLFEFEFI